MILIEPKGRPFIACPKCRQNVVWPEALSADDKSALAQASRRSRLEGAQLAHRKYDLDLREAKALSLHISEDGRCHRCAAPVTEELSICTKCRSANLNW